MRRALGLMATALVVGTPVAAQDIEAVARMRGIELPAAYYQRVQTDPTAYKLPNGFFRTTADGRRVATRASGTMKIPIVLALFAVADDHHAAAADLLDRLLDRGERGVPAL